MVWVKPSYLIIEGHAHGGKALSWKLSFMRRQDALPVRELLVTKPAVMFLPAWQSGW